MKAMLSKLRLPDYGCVADSVAIAGTAILVILWAAVLVSLIIGPDATTRCRDINIEGILAATGDAPPPTQTDSYWYKEHCWKGMAR
jgi:hypothetical protein